MRIRSIDDSTTSRELAFALLTVVNADTLRFNVTHASAGRPES
jgi:hypothetical protein